MLQNCHQIRRRNRASIAALLSLAFAAGGCTGGGVFGTPAATEPDVSATSPSLTDRMSNFFSGSSAQSPQAVAGAQPDLNCPSVQIRAGASTLTIGPTGDNATMSLKYQGSFVRAARECAVVGGSMVMKIGVQGRIIVGPAGGPGQVDVPLRVAIVQETPAGARPIVTKFIRIPVTVGSNAEGALFTHIEEGMSFPLPTPTAVLDDYTAYIGFDPLSAEAQDKPKPKPGPKTKPKPKPAAGSG
jgi:hypothetical protein